MQVHPIFGKAPLVRMLRSVGWSVVQLVQWQTATFALDKTGLLVCGWQGWEGTFFKRRIPPKSRILKLSTSNSLEYSMRQKQTAEPSGRQALLKGMRRHNSQEDGTANTEQKKFGLQRCCAVWWWKIVSGTDLLCSLKGSLPMWFGIRRQIDICVISIQEHDSLLWPDDWRLQDFCPSSNVLSTCPALC